jgi:hypothetical protein
MSEEVDELFGGGEGTPAPRFGLAMALLGGGLILTVFGMACTAAPGGLVVLMGWFVADKEMRRVESGYLPADVEPRVQMLQRLANVDLALVLVLFALQVVLLCTGFYDQLWLYMVQLVVPVLQGLMG